MNQRLKTQKQKICTGKPSKLHFVLTCFGLFKQKNLKAKRTWKVEVTAPLSSNASNRDLRRCCLCPESWSGTEAPWLWPAERDVRAGCMSANRQKKRSCLTTNVHRLKCGQHPSFGRSLRLCGRPYGFIAPVLQNLQLPSDHRLKKDSKPAVTYTSLHHLLRILLFSQSA